MSCFGAHTIHKRKIVYFCTRIYKYEFVLVCVCVWVCIVFLKWQSIRICVWVPCFFSFVVFFSRLKFNCLLRLFHLSLSLCGDAFCFCWSCCFPVSIPCECSVSLFGCAVAASHRILSFVIWLKHKLINHSCSWHTFACLGLNDRTMKNKKTAHRTVTSIPCDEHSLMFFMFTSMFN